MVAMPARMAACGLAKVTGSPRHSTSPESGPVHPGQHLDQGGLAGAVLPEQAVHLTGAHLQLHPVQGPYAREGLHHVGEAQHHLARDGVGGRLDQRSICHDDLLGLLGHDASPKATSLARTAAPATPARGPSSDRTTGRLPVASGSDRR